MAERTTKPRIVVPTPFFDPAYKAGGAAKSILNLVDALSDEFAFDVHCLDTDIDGERLDLPARRRSIGAGGVHYHRPADLGWTSMRGWLRSGDLLYLNGFFAPVFSLKVAAIRRADAKLRQRPLLIAPRGEVFDKTLKLKSVKKRLAIAGVKAAGLYRDAHWHASTDEERTAIAAVADRLGQRAPDVHVACDVASVQSPTPPSMPRDAVPRLVFFSRLSPKKNLDFALRALARIAEPLTLDIIGPIEDQGYWASCQDLIAAVPQHRVVYRGTVTPAEVPATLTRYDLLLFPTQSENFGHVIQEALAAGVPVLVSDQTPWRGLAEAGAGWDLPLDETRFADAMRRFRALSAPDRAAMREAARRFSHRFDAADAVEDHRRMLRAVLTSGARP